MGKGTPLLLFWEKSPFQKLREDGANPPTLLWPLLEPSPTCSKAQLCLRAFSLWAGE